MTVSNRKGSLELVDRADCCGKSHPYLVGGYLDISIFVTYNPKRFEKVIWYITRCLPVIWYRKCIDFLCTEGRNSFVLYVILYKYVLSIEFQFLISFYVHYINENVMNTMKYKLHKVIKFWWNMKKRLNVMIVVFVDYYWKIHRK